MTDKSACVPNKINATLRTEENEESIPMFNLEARMARFFISKVSIFAIPLILTACAGADFSYRAPINKTIENEIILDKPFEYIWDGYVAELSKSFFVINNIEKSSRLINVSFSANTPSKYVDCGITTLVSKHPARGEETFVYSVADDSQMWAGVKGTNHIVNRRRNTSLDGRINIFIAPERGGTLVRVNARYVMNFQIQETGVTYAYNNSYNNKLSFSSNEPATDNEVTCRSTGALEAELIRIARVAGS